LLILRSVAAQVDSYMVELNAMTQAEEPLSDARPLASSPEFYVSL
jgi:hypothetical protein